MLPRLRFGFPVRDDPSPGALAAFGTAFRERTGLEAVPVFFHTYDALITACERRDLELAWAPPLVAIDLEARRLAWPIVAVARRGGTGYYSALVVQRGSPIREPKDLVGKRVAYVAPTSSAGYLVPRLWLKTKGLDPKTTFGEERFAGTHQAAVDLVLRGEVDVATVFAHADPTKGGIRVEGPEDQLRVVGAAGPVPSDVVVATELVAPMDRQRVALALLALPSDTLTPLMGVSRFEPLPVGHLDPLRRMMGFGPVRSGLDASAPSAERGDVARVGGDFSRVV